MCTAISYSGHSHCFGRTLDYVCCCGESVAITPRNYPFYFRHGLPLDHHHAIIGMARLEDGYPLYFDAVNEMGLGMAGLNFPLSAVYYPPADNRHNICPFELIPWLLGSCASVRQARPLLRKLNLTNTAFSKEIPLSPLHWLLADREEALVVESTAGGLQAYDVPVGVLTNEPPFPHQMYRLADMMSLHPEPPENRFDLPLAPYSLGMGAIGLPGDLSSTSRFLRAAFALQHSPCADSEEAAVSQFFHLTDFVAQPLGCTITSSGEYENTRYTSCCNTAKGIYYYTTYKNSRITAVHLHREDLEGTAVISYPLRTKQDILLQN